MALSLVEVLIGTAVGAFMILTVSPMQALLLLVYIACCSSLSEKNKAIVGSEVCDKNTKEGEA